MYTSCNNCGCETTDLSTCPSCEVDPVTQIVPCGKYVKVTDHCKRERLLENKEQSLLYSNGNQACFYDGSDTKKILLGNMRSSAGLNSVAGLHNNALTQLIPSGASTKWLRYQAGSISFAELFQTPCYTQSSVADMPGAGYVAFLYDDGSGNFCIKKLQTNAVGPQNSVVTQDPATNLFSWQKHHNLDHDASSCVIYYWNNVTQLVEKLEPPTLAAGEVYSNYRLSLNDATGCPEWTKVTSQDQPALARFTFNPGNTGASPDVGITVAKVYDGGGASPRFQAIVQPTIAGQVSAIATAEVGPVASSKHCGLYWALNGVEVLYSYGRNYVAVASAGPQSVATFCDVMQPTDVLTLRMRTEGSQAEWFNGNIILNHFSVIP